MEGNLAGRSSTLSMHVSFEPEIPLAAIYSTDVLGQVCLQEQGCSPQGSF